MRLLASWLTFFISGTTHSSALTVEVVGEFADPFDDLLVIIAVEGRNGGQQDVQNDAGRPYIASLVVAAGNDLGRDVVRLYILVFTVPTNFFSPFSASSFFMSFFHL